MFFEPSSFKARSLDMSYFTEWAGEIANSYLNSGIAPTESLSKIAQSESLTPHQISLLAGEANKEIHKHKYASAKDKYFAANFPLADAKQVINDLQIDGGAEKVAVNMPEPKLTPPEIDVFAAFGVKPEEMDKTAEVKKGLKMASVGGDFVKEKYKDKVLLAKFAADAAEEKFIKMARAMAAQKDTATERFAFLGELAAFVKSAGMRDVGFKPLAKLAYVLGQDGLIHPKKAEQIMELFMKVADQTAPEDLISKWLPAKIINGEHPLYITLKTVKDSRNVLEDYRNRHKIVQDQLYDVKQKVRAL